MIKQIDLTRGISFVSDTYSKEAAAEEMFDYIKGLLALQDKENFSCYIGFYWKHAGDCLCLLEPRLKTLGYKQVYLDTWTQDIDDNKSIRFGRLWVDLRKS